MELRRLRLSDGPAWQRARRAAEQRLAGSFDQAGLSFSRSTSLTAFADTWWSNRHEVRAGRYVPFVAIRDHGDVVGELAFVIDPRTGVAEASLWADQSLSPGATTWIAAAGLLRMLALPQGVVGILAPVAVDNPGPARLLQQFGFEHRGLARQLRRHHGQVVDHDVWWLEPDERHLARLGAMVAAQLA